MSQPVKKKKGRSPAHNNVFAFRHNPKSKKTAQILANPITHTCQRCTEKLEWRKKYRKYKPLTQPATCNICRRRNITAAYHTVCTKCTVESEKAVALLKEWNENENSAAHDIVVRACAMCFKEPALPEEEEEDAADIGGDRRMKLRERKALERQREREQSKKKTNDECETCSQQESSDDESTESNACIENKLDKVALHEDANDTEEREDPFLKAVGGKEKLLTGTAYQQMLLSKDDAS